MRTRLFFLMILLLGTLVQGNAQKSANKKIVGKWYNPFTYESMGELRGFHFKRNGKCEALGIKTLELKTWKIEKGCLVIDGIAINEDGTREPYNTSEKIDKLTADTLSVIAAEKPFKLTFLYMPKKALKKWMAKKDKQLSEAKMD